MHFRFSAVHPRVIQLSREEHANERDPRVFAFSFGGGCEPQAGKSRCAHGPEVFATESEPGQGFGSRGFGVKRPLRFLAFKLDLSEPQIAALAAILDELKTERAQAAVDDRRALAAFAEAMSGATFDATKAAGSATLRTTSAERLGAAVVKALGRIHALLTPEQRERFAYLIRTGTVVL